MAGIELPDWMRATALIGFDDPDYRAITVDEHGQLNVLLRGAYNDEIRTVTLDDEGRISAFVIDSADAWGDMLSIGNAELAARLGSPVFFHQSGRVLFVESWEHGIARWFTPTSGLGGSVALCPTSYETHGYSAKLTAGSTAGHWAGGHIYMGVLATGRVGLSVSFAVTEAVESFLAQLWVRDGTHRSEASVLLNDVTDKAQVQTGAAAWEDAGDFDLVKFGASYYNHLKWIIDLSTRTYGNIYVNRAIIDASSKQCYQVPDGAGPEVAIVIKLVGNAAENDVVYVDNIVLTGTEP